MIVVQSFRYKLYPSEDQKQAMLQASGCRRFVWNWALARCNEHYRSTGKGLSKFALFGELTAFKKTDEGAFLRNVSLIAIRSSLVSLETAYKVFFAKRSRYPRFKSRHCDPVRFAFNDAVVKASPGSVTLPVIGTIKAKGRECPGKVITASVKQDADGNWYASLQCKVKIAPLPNSKNEVGIDIGLTSLATLSTGEKIDAPKFYRSAARKLKRASQSVSRKKKGSASRAKAKKRLGVVHRNIKRKREGHLHELTTRIVRQNGLIAVEDLNIKGMAKTKLSKSILDAAWGELIRQLEYKSRWYGREFVKVGRFYPSSKTCSNCGFVQALKLSDRIWKCELCGSVHDRDYNAAVNILAEGKRIVAERTSETQNACGEGIRPGTNRQSSAKQEGSI